MLAICAGFEGLKIGEIYLRGRPRGRFYFGFLQDIWLNLAFNISIVLKISKQR